MSKREIFVFGSNREGRHGKGAALEAVRKHGAIYRQPIGLQGNSYAIVTKEIRRGYDSVGLNEIAIGVRDFMIFAMEHPDWQFNVTPIGCGLAGFKPEQIAPLFANAPPNVLLPDSFCRILAVEYQI